MYSFCSACSPSPNVMAGAGATNLHMNVNAVPFTSLSYADDEEQYALRW